MTVQHLFEFGEFRLSVDERTIQRGDENIALTPKMYELLLVLVRNPNRTLEKEFLLESVWPDSFVEEGNITYNIAQLRRVLGDDAQTPRYIETVPRRGYRFIEKVTEFAADVELLYDSAASTEPESRLRKARRHLVSASAGILFFAAAAGVLIWFVRSRAAQATTILSIPFTLQKLSTDGQVYQAAISKDGSSVVYTRRNAGKQSIWLRNLETSENMQVLPPLQFIYYGIALAPDDKFIYFARGPVSHDNRQIDIFRTSISGGVPQRIISETQGWISISPEGDRISFVRCPMNEEEFCSLWIADSLNGANEKKLASRPAPFRIGDNQISPDGKTVAFAVGQSRTASNEFGLAAVDIESGTERQLTSEKFFNIRSVVWLPGGQELLFTARKQSEKNFRILHVNSAGNASILTSDSQSYSLLSLDGEGGRLISTQITSNFHLNLYHRARPDPVPMVLTKASTVAFTPDDKLMFSSSATGNEDIWTMDENGGGERQLTIDPSDDVAPIVSPDNNSIYFASNRTGSIQAWKMNVDGSGQTEITTQEGGSPLVVSPEGDWLYYKTGMQKTIRRVSLRDGRDESVFERSSADSAISPDAARVALTEIINGDRMLTVVSATDGGLVETYHYPDSRQLPTCLVWSRDGNSLAYVFGDETSQALWIQPLNEKTPVKVVDLENEVFELSGLAWSFDGKSFAVIKGTWDHDAVLIEGLK